MQMHPDISICKGGTTYFKVKNFLYEKLIDMRKKFQNVLQIPTYHNIPAILLMERALETVFI